MDQQFSEARMRAQNIYNGLKCAVVLILCLLLVIICLLILTVILVNNIGSGGNDDGLHENESSTRPNNQVICDEGWFEKTEFDLGCLLFHYEKMNYVDAKKFCRDRGANLIRTGI